MNTTVTNILSVFKDGAQFVSDDNNIDSNTAYNIWYDPHVGNMAIGMKNSNQLFISRDRGRTFLDISRLTNDSYPASNERFLYIAFDYLHNHMYTASSDAYIYVVDLNEETLRFRKLYEDQCASTGIVYHRGISKIIMVTRDMTSPTGFDRVAIIDSINSSAPTIVNLPYHMIVATLQSHTIQLVAHWLQHSMVNTLLLYPMMLVVHGLVKRLRLMVNSIVLDTTTGNLL